ncbi:hypothetical protein N7528_004952 [Penicillium herquei]|nr:hypothetical protein N7528_004952 [Penicillium herquei]
MSEFKLVNSNEPVPGAGIPPPEFTLKATPVTDVWAKAPSTISFNAPIFYREIPLELFKQASVEFNAEWAQKYDQGGLILVINKTDGSQKWVKAGIEMTHGKPHISVVCKDRWADWSIRPVPSGGQAAKLEFVREADDSLWIYLVEGEQKSPIREVTWIFFEENVQETWAGVYAARPTEDGGELTVNFGNLVIDLA